MNTIVTSREAILEASRKIAVEQGLGAINMRMVAGACGVAVGSIYNYFPSKAELLSATIAVIWEDIFHMSALPQDQQSFCGCIQWLFEQIQQGSRKYPGLLAVHAGRFSREEKEKGRSAMDSYFIRVKQYLLSVLQKDSQVRQDVFCGSFTQERFVDFVFTIFLSLLTENRQECSDLLQLITCSVYKKSHD